MNRRHFSLQIAAAAALNGLALRPAAAQGGPVEGSHFLKLNQPAPVAAPAGKIEVVEFFWYGCPHCNAFEPTLEPWVKALPADVVFRRAPVAFGAVHETHQKIYYALEAMGQLPALHRKVFAAIHVNKQRLDKEADIVAFMAANGVDGAKFSDTFKSFSVSTKAKQARQLAEAYRIDGVPTLGIQGQFTTAASMPGVGDGERALRVVDFLVQRLRKPA